MKTERSKMESAIPSAEQPVATRRSVPLAISDVNHLFVYHKCNKTVPFRPKGGEVYVFRPTTLRKLTIGCRTDTCFHVKVHGKLKEELAL